jgi:hypothetical protein
VWGEDYFEQAHYSTTRIVLAKDLQEDWKLHRRFRSDFGGFPVQHIRTSLSHNPLGGERWTSLLVASEGIIDDYNFMTLLRSNETSVRWIAGGATSSVLFVEVARIDEKVYNGMFRSNLHLFDTKTQGDVLSEALGGHQDVALQGLHRLRTQWPYPRKRVLRQSGILGIVKRGLTASTTQVIRNTCQELLQYWRDVMDLARAPRQLTKDRMIEALQRAGRVYFQGQETASSSTLAITRTTSSLSDITSTKQDAVRAHVSAGTVICFDVRVLHCGLANASQDERPLMYFTFARD